MEACSKMLQATKIEIIVILFLEFFEQIWLFYRSSLKSFTESKKS